MYKCREFFCTNVITYAITNVNKKQYANVNKNVLTLDFTNLYKQKGNTNVLINVFTYVNILSNVTLPTVCGTIQTMN